MKISFSVALSVTPHFFHRLVSYGRRCGHEGTDHQVAEAMVFQLSQSMGTKDIVGYVAEQTQGDPHRVTE